MFFGICLFFCNFILDPLVPCCFIFNIVAQDLVQFFNLALANHLLVDLHAPMLLLLHLEEHARVHFVIFYIVPNDSIDDIPGEIADAHDTLRAIH